MAKARKKRPPAKSAKRPPPPKAKARPKAPPPPGPAAAKRADATTPTEAERELAFVIHTLAVRTGQSPRDVLARAVVDYAAKVAPDLREAARRTEHAHAEPAPVPRLVVKAEGHAPIELWGGELLIGGDEACGLRITSPLVAPMHARVAFKDGVYVYEDLQSRHGSYAKGEKLDVLPLSGGEVVDVGGYLPVTFELVPA